MAASFTTKPPHRPHGAPVPARQLSDGMKARLSAVWLSKIPWAPMTPPLVAVKSQRANTHWTRIAFTSHEDYAISRQAITISQILILTWLHQPQTHTHIGTNMHTPTYAQTNVHIDMRAEGQAHSHVYAHGCRYAHLCINKCSHTHACIDMHANLRVCTRAYIRRHVCTLTCMHTHAQTTHIDTCVCRCACAYT